MPTSCRVGGCYNHGVLDYRSYPELSDQFLKAHPLDDPRFEEWLEATYSEQATSDHEDGFYPDERIITLWIARSWMMGSELTNRFSLEAIGEAIWSQQDEIGWYASPSNGGRIIWDATAQLYTNVFEPNADRTLGHLSEGNSRFQGALYMFWDSARWYAGPESTEGQRRSFLSICERALFSRQASVQESALHGLGHASDDMPEAKQAIQRFLRKGKARRPEIRTYAESALKGSIC